MIIAIIIESLFWWKDDGHIFGWCNRGNERMSTAERRMGEGEQMSGIASHYISLSSFNQCSGIHSQTHTHTALLECGVMANCSHVCVSQLVKSLLLLFLHIKACADPWHTLTHSELRWIRYKSEKFPSSRFIPFCSLITKHPCLPSSHLQILETICFQLCMGESVFVRACVCALMHVCVCPAHLPNAGARQKKIKK